MHKAFLPSSKKIIIIIIIILIILSPALVYSEIDEGALEQATGRVLGYRIERP